MRVLCAVLVLICCIPVSGIAETHILFLDGARIEHEIAARDGYLEIPLPAAMLPNTLRVKPLATSSLLRVEVSPAASDRKSGREASALAARRDSLRDKLRILEEREAIFKAAAKSQSGRAPKKTKSNPEPLESVRKGTSFALGQLEAVSTLRRKVEKELADAEQKLAVMNNNTAAGSMARVWLSQKHGSVRVAYLVSDHCWTPQYDFRLRGDNNVEMVLRARVPQTSPKVSLAVVPLTLTDVRATMVAPVPVSDDFAVVATFRLPLSQENLTSGAIPSVSFSFANSSGTDLPSGDAFSYWRGEYYGMSRFAGCRENAACSMVSGR